MCNSIWTGVVKTEHNFPDIMVTDKTKECNKYYKKMSKEVRQESTLSTSGFQTCINFNFESAVFQVSRKRL